MTATLPDLLTTLARDGGQPRLTWYGTGGERIELSGAVLANWVAKTTNLLVEEFDAEPGLVVTTDLPPHWRTLVWALATWRSGAHLEIVGAEGPVPAARVVVTADPSRWTTPEGARPPRTELVAVSLAALARRYDGELPRGALDAASAVMTYGDQLGYVPPWDASAVALSGDGVDGTVEHGGLLPWSAEHSAVDAAHGGRVLLRTTDEPGGAVGMVATALTVWARGGSVVCLAPQTTASLEADPARLARLIETERITID